MSHLHDWEQRSSVSIVLDDDCAVRLCFDEFYESDTGLRVSKLEKLNLSPQILSTSLRILVEEIGLQDYFSSKKLLDPLRFSIFQKRKVDIPRASNANSFVKLVETAWVLDTRILICLV